MKKGFFIAFILLEKGIIMSFGENNVPPPFPTSGKLSVANDDQKALFVGEKYEKYYKGKFEQITPTKQMAGFNIGAFFLGPIWLFYRKMYAYGAFYIAFVFTSGIVTTIFEISESIDRAISTGLAVTMGLGGNALYKYFVEKRIKTISENHPSNIEEALVEKGGTNSIAAWGLLIVFVILIYLSV